VVVVVVVVVKDVVDGGSEKVLFVGRIVRSDVLLELWWEEGEVEFVVVEGTRVEPRHGVGVIR
jgi:hypothetical protein